MEDKVKKLLEEFGQEHLISDLKQFSEEELKTCALQLEGWDQKEIYGLKESWKNRAAPLIFESFSDPGELLSGTSTKKRAVLFLAGGQGSRLGFQGPKGCYPLLGKTLFQRHCEKMHPYASAAILTSHLNHRETVSYFDSQSYFGLKKLVFFEQKTLPLFDDDGKWFWMGRGKIAEGPDGNGSVFSAMEDAGVLRRFEEEGIELLHVVSVDNPLADPFDPLLAAFHEKERADVSFKCIHLEDSEEPMGRLISMGGRLAIAEYAELTADERIQNRYANTGIFVFDLPFVKRLSHETFPMHWAYRATAYWSRQGEEKRFAWKGERFIVDALLWAKKSVALLASRNSCYAPLKEKKSIGEIEKQLML